jgi:hypothetical protein
MSSTTTLWQRVLAKWRAASIAKWRAAMSRCFSGIRDVRESFGDVSVAMVHLPAEGRK